MQTYFTRCAAQLHQQGIAQTMYAGDYRGRITPGDGYEPTGHHIWYTDRVVDLGHLVAGKYLPPLESKTGVRYVEDHPLWCYSIVRPGYRNPGGEWWANELIPKGHDFTLSGWKVPGRVVINGYEFRTQMDLPQNVPTNTLPAAKLQSLMLNAKGILQEKVSSSSITSCIWSWSAGQAFSHKGKYNVLVGDGSVRPFLDRKVGQTTLLKTSPYVSGWPHSYRGDVIFAIFDRELGLRPPKGVRLPTDFKTYYPY
jgi:hypothetical protein